MTFFMLLEAPKLTERLHTHFPDKQEFVVKMTRMSRYVMDFIVVQDRD